MYVAKHYDILMEATKLYQYKQKDYKINIDLLKIEAMEIPLTMIESGSRLELVS